MCRGMKLHFKTGMAIFFFSLLVTLVFSAIMINFSSMLVQNNTEKGSVYVLNEKDYQAASENGGYLLIDSKKLIKISDYNSLLISGKLEKLIPISVFFLIILFVLSICLWRIMKYIQLKQMMKIVTQVNSMATDDIDTVDPLLKIAYEKLRQKFDDQFNDFKKLNLFLSHEQKNAVAILRASLEISENHEHLKYVDNVADGIDNILTLSENVDNSPMTIVDVSVICAEVYDNYHKFVDNLIFDFLGDEDTEIFAKRRWIYRAVANLLDNAIKYGNGKPIILSVRAKHNSVIVSLKDHGIGIEEDKQEQIFNEHYRINELNKDGFGIGLSLVAHVCDLCGGFVMLESEVNVGSTFYLSFPQKSL